MVEIYGTQRPAHRVYNIRSEMDYHTYDVRVVSVQGVLEIKYTVFFAFVQYPIF